MCRIAVPFCLVFALVSPSGLFASEKKDFAQAYKNKFFVVARDGLQLAICSKNPQAFPGFEITLTETGADSSRQGFAALMVDSDCRASLESVRKGEVLESRGASVGGGWLHIYVRAVAPHAVNRGIGANEHESHERPAALLKFSVKDGYDEAKKVVDEWLRTFHSQDEAVTFGNTVSGGFVKEVKLGMTFAEVEKQLGAPQTRVDLEKKVLYKYKDMTVEFQDGKVSDVR